MPLYNPDIGLISTIQKGSTQAGPGLRTVVFFKGCSLGCLWCDHPELIRPVPDLLFSREKCDRCGACIEVCPRKALSFDPEGLIVVDRGLCDACAACLDACPQDALEVSGRYTTVEKLTEELLVDRDEILSSNGGVTFSGGEPLWQAGFVAQIAKTMRAEGIHTALDTTGDVSWCRFEEVLPFIDLVLYEIHAASNELHRQLTGRNNDLILMNARLLAEREIPMHVRLVLVPGLNDSRAEICARMEFISELNSVCQVDLLPYRNRKTGQYARLGLDDPLVGLPEYNQAQWDEIVELVKSYGILTIVNGL